LLLVAPDGPLRAAGPAPAPLHQRIDRLVAAGHKDRTRRAAPPASDAEFLRRVYLDLTGTIPTSAEARAFLADKTADKREKLIDHLLASPEFARRLAMFFDVMLMERRPDQHVPHGQWHEYLRASFAANKPWDKLAREILSADGADPKMRPAAKFILDRAAEPNLVTRDVSRLFLGMNLQCAQCHDHPRIEDYRQQHYYGLYAFLSRTSVVTDNRLRLVVLSEKADGEVSFQSVFDRKKTVKNTTPRVPGGPALIDPADPKLKGYVAAPANGVRGVPRFSRRTLLAGALARGDYAPFRRNIANRLWALMMGRGLVEPLDLDHSDNPPSHPELLDLLGREMAAHQFNIKWMLRQLALSATYQRASALPDGVREKDAPPYAAARLKPLSPEQLAFGLMQATGLTDHHRVSLGKGATEAALYARLSGNVGPFVQSFGARPGNAEGFDSRIDQALFLANGPLVRSWLNQHAHGLTDRLSRLTTGDAVAEELYLSILTRSPDAEERKEVREFLAGKPADRSGALRDLAWALLASAEFRFNH
jgi:hypothetical protein